MRGKTIVITGATSGIGAVAARTLAARGARILLIARDDARGEQMLRHLQALNPEAAHGLYLADLSRLEEMQRTGRAIAAAESRIDVLMNNAGMISFSNERTVDGLEVMFATNHMSYFVITSLLLERLRAAPGARIVSTASEAHRGRTLDFERLGRGNGTRGYGVTKLCNILFTRELARRIAGTGVTANCLHPGFVATRFGDNSRGAVRMGFQVAKRLFAIRPEQGAETLVFLASAAEVANETGGYYVRRARTEPSREACNEADARRLWELSERLAGAPFGGARPAA
jgi:NAD(P)-dependent dehydrogenase (short-subunit alcohol dehydrogenase family)